jgi:FkbM family methyltransferase
MIARPMRAVGRRLRNYTLPLIGFWDLVARFEELRRRIEEIDAKLGQVGFPSTALDARDKRLIATVEAEVERLDGYLVHHMSTLRTELATVQGDIRSLSDRQFAPNHWRERTCTVHGYGTLILADGFDLLVPTQEVGLLSFLLRHGMGAVEPGVRAVLCDRLRPGDVAVDGGANIGIHSLTMGAAVGATGNLVCFEPLPHVADALAWTLRLNGMVDHVRLERAALSDTVGEGTLHSAPHSPMSSLFNLPDGTSARPLIVPSVTLDSRLPPGSRVDLVKLDIEGAEPRAWRGMRRVRDENQELDIVVEWSGSHFTRAAESPVEFFRAIRADGFSVFVIEDAPKAGRLARLDDESVAVALEGANLLLTRRLLTRG